MQAMLWVLLSRKHSASNALGIMGLAKQEAQCKQCFGNSGSC